MAQALIGHTGFVGGTILRQTQFDATYNSTNIEQIAQREYDLIVCAGAPGRKWHANQNPDEDRESIQRLIVSLKQVKTREFILISTVDVYPNPLEVDEDTPIDDAANTPYGRHRRWLEQFALETFPGLVVRLPGLFGRGLKKNVVYDFLHDNHLDLVCPESVFQFYDLTHLWSDIDRCRTSGLRVVNFATEPLSVRTLAREVFGVEFNNPSALRPVRYDMRTLFADVLGGRDSYAYDATQVLDGLRRFVREDRTH